MEFVNKKNAEAEISKSIGIYFGTSFEKRARGEQVPIEMHGLAPGNLELGMGYWGSVYVAFNPSVLGIDSYCAFLDLSEDSILASVTGNDSAASYNARFEDDRRVGRQIFYTRDHTIQPLAAIRNQQGNVYLFMNVNFADPASDIPMVAKWTSNFLASIFSYINK